MERITIIEMAPALDVFYDIEEGSPGNNGRSLTVDGESAVIRSDSKFRPRLRFNPGGKGVNVARVLARLADVGYRPIAIELHVFCKPGPLADALVTMLRREKRLAGRVEIVHHPVGAEQPRICANTAVVRRGSLRHEFNFSPHAEIDEASRRELLDRLNALHAPGDWVVLAGTPPTVGTGNGTDPLLFRDAVARLDRTQIVLDTSGESLDHCLTSGLPQLHVVKINHEEADESAALLSAYDGIRVVTDPRGAQIHQGHRRLGTAHIARPPAVRCTLGAGDSVTAGFLLRYLETHDPLESTRYGQAVALALVSSYKGIRGISPRSVKRHLGDLEIR